MKNWIMLLVIAPAFVCGMGKRKRDDRGYASQLSYAERTKCELLCVHAARLWAEGKCDLAAGTILVIINHYDMYPNEFEAHRLLEYLDKKPEFNTRDGQLRAKLIEKYGER